MGLRSWWQTRQLTRATRFLEAHHDLALTALRATPELGVAAVNAVMAEQLARASDPGRQTAPWPILTQLGHGARQALTQTLPKATPFNLRRFSEYPPSRKAINAIKHPISDLSWTIRPIPDPRRADLDPSAEELAQILTATRVLQYPNDDESWKTFIEQVAEDVIVGGYGAIEVGRSDDPERPVWLWPVDGQSIRINANWSGAPTEPRYSQSLAYVGLSVGTQERVELTDDELIYLKLNPRTNTPFGLGYLEVAFSSVNAWLGATEYAERRASNAVPNFAIFLGENVDFATARMWREYWTQQIEGYGQVPILGGGKAPQVLALQGTGEDQLFIRWQEMLLRIIALSFGLSPITLNLERDVNRSTGMQMDASDWDAIRPVANTLSDYLTRRLLWHQLGYTSLEFYWLIRDTDEVRQAEILERQYGMNAITIDEIRDIYEREPLPDGRGALTKSAYEAAALAQYGPGDQNLGFGGPPDLADEAAPVAVEDDAS